MAPSLRVIAFNWRDMRHPAAGGAEVHLHEILRRLVSRGHHVVQLSSGWRGAASRETVDGIEVRRAGAWWNANITLPALYVHERLHTQADIVLEDINKIPFFTPLFARVPVLGVVPHLFGRTVYHEASLPMAAYVHGWEQGIRPVYANTPLLAISESTRDDLVGRGLPGRHIAVSHCGLDHAIYTPGEPTHDPRLIVYLGRLQKYKGVQLALHALVRVRETLPDVRMVVIGDGPYRTALERQARTLGVAGVVEFRGFVPAADKVAWVRRAGVVVNPSPKEGWGLTMVESAACGTPVVASRSPGLRDSVRDGETGFLVPHGDVAALADRTIEILADPALRQRLAAGGLAWAARFTWDRCAAEAETVIRAAAGGSRDVAGLVP